MTYTKFCGTILNKVQSLAALALAALLLAAPAAAAPAAKSLFGAKPDAAPLPAEVFGFYTKGCVAGAVQLPADGPHHQAMRPSRNRAWGHPELIDFVLKLAEKAHDQAGWPGILVGDLAQPRGGPMTSGHASHQVGLDADIWLMPAPDRRYTVQEREDVSARSMLRKGKMEVDPAIWTDGQATVLKAAASDPRVERIFINPGIKKKLCETAGKDRKWLSKIRPWYGHHYHFHVRLSCPRGSSECRDQAPPAADDGCGDDLARWFRPPPKPKKPTKPPKPKPELTMADLPKACRQVLDAK